MLQNNAHFENSTLLRISEKLICDCKEILNAAHQTKGPAVLSPRLLGEITGVWSSFTLAYNSLKMPYIIKQIGVEFHKNVKRKATDNLED